MNNSDGLPDIDAKSIVIVFDSIARTDSLLSVRTIVRSESELQDY